MLDTFTPVNANDLTKEEKQRALAALMFLTKKEKYLKARAYADGRKQQEWTDKD